MENKKDSKTNIGSKVAVDKIAYNDTSKSNSALAAKVDAFDVPMVLVLPGTVI